MTDYIMRIYVGEEAERLLASKPFQEAWTVLSSCCPWGTCYQDSPFVTTWYRCYAHQFEPVIVTKLGNGHLTGLFTLARQKSTGALCAAGSHQAEYHVWLATPSTGEQFIEEAVESLAGLFSVSHLELLFVPPKTPLTWTGNGKTRCYLRPITRPLMRTFPADSIRESMRKKSNKSRLARLQKEGSLDFQRLNVVDELQNVLDAVTSIYDFRQGGRHGVLPFHDDDHKRRFYLALMQQPGLLHVTVLKVGKHMAAAHIGQCNRDEVVLGIFAYSPFFARYSTGKLHLLFLGLCLEQDGFAALDLTPGGEYKDRFASHSDLAYVLRIFFSPTAALTHRLLRRVIEFGKRFAAANQIRDYLRAARRKTNRISLPSLPGKMWRFAKRFVYEWREYRLYRYSVETVATPKHEGMKRDALSDLMLYAPAEAWQPPLDQFLQEAAENLAGGQHVYTHVARGRLAHYGWMIERQQEASITEVNQKLTLPEHSAVLYNFYTHPEHRRMGLYRRALAQMIHDAAQIPGTRYIYIGALRSNVASCHAIEKAGFQYQRSLFQRKILGRISFPGMESN